MWQPFPFVQHDQFCQCDECKQSPLAENRNWPPNSRRWNRCRAQSILCKWAPRFCLRGIISQNDLAPVAIDLREWRQRWCHRKSVRNIAVGHDPVITNEFAWYVNMFLGVSNDDVSYLAINEHQHWWLQSCLQKISECNHFARFIAHKQQFLIDGVCGGITLSNCDS